VDIYRLDGLPDMGNQATCATEQAVVNQSVMPSISLPVALRSGPSEQSDTPFAKNFLKFLSRGNHGDRRTKGFGTNEL
jgi:hypothetical protein